MIDVLEGCQLVNRISTVPLKPKWNTNVGSQERIDHKRKAQVKMKL